MKRRRYMRIRKPTRRQWALIAASAPVLVVALIYLGRFIEWYTPVLLDLLLPWR